jgi:hypothetical protein
MKSSLTIMPYMMNPGDHRIIADAIYEGLSNPDHYENPVIPTGTPAQVHGSWGVTIQYLRGVGEQKFTLEQSGNDLTGAHAGEIYNSKIKGTIHAEQIELHSRMEVPGNVIPWTFKGRVQGSQMTGSVNMGEYGNATWKATRA